MIPLSEMNTLMLLEEILEEAKSAEELYVTLLLGRGKRPEVPLRLPSDLNQFLAVHARRGTLVREPFNGEVKYKVNPLVADAVRRQIKDGFTPDVEAFLATIGDNNAPRPMPEDQAA